MDMPASPSQDLRAEFLFHSLLRAHFNAQQSMLAGRGLANLGSPRVLFALQDLDRAGRDAPSQRELADLLRISPATATASLRSLEKSGYSTRSPDPHDSRCNRITITPMGSAAADTCRDTFCSVDRYMFHDFTPEERQLVVRLHRRMLQNLYQIGGDGPDCPPPPFPEKG